MSGTGEVEGPLLTKMYFQENFKSVVHSFNSEK